MKKISSILLCAALFFGLTACGNSTQSRTEYVFSGTSKQDSEPISSVEESTRSTAETASSDIAEPPEIPDSETAEKTHVVYFTWSSNTEGMAKTIAELTGGDIFEIVPAKPYPENYNACTEVALAERDSNARPEIQNLPQSVSEYDNIIIGYLIWWHTAPMIIGTFLESYDLTGIDVYPFSQSASMDTNQFAQSMDFVRNCSGNGIVHDGLFTRPNNTNAITEYLEQNGLMLSSGSRSCIETVERNTDVLQNRGKNLRRLCDDNKRCSVSRCWSCKKTVWRESKPLLLLICTNQ